MENREAARDERFMTIYRMLRAEHGPQRWWPVTTPGETKPKYTGGPRSARQRFEVAVGAILTQNTAWSNAARAIEELNKAGLMSPRALAAVSETILARAIRSSGYYNQKARRLKALAAFHLRVRSFTREALLALHGVGPETADSIMLYARGEPLFVVDAYTRRMFGNLGLIAPRARYEEIRCAFERNVPRRLDVYREYHALIVEHGKKTCKKKPICEQCSLKGLCSLHKKEHRKGKREKELGSSPRRGDFLAEGRRRLS